HNNLALSVWFMDGPGRSAEILLEGIRYGRRRGLGTEFLEANFCAALAAIGRWDEALARIHELAERLEPGDWKVARSNLHRVEARILAYRGAYEHALRHAEQALRVARQIGAVDWIVIAASVEA